MQNLRSGVYMRVNLLYSLGILVIGLGLLSSGCGTGVRSHKKHILVHPKAAMHTLDFNRGYEQGCGSGRNAVGDVEYGFKKDGVNYSGNREYRAGWDEGYAICQEEYLTEVQNRVKQNTDFNVNDNEHADVRHKIWEELRK